MQLNNQGSDSLCKEGDSNSLSDLRTFISLFMAHKQKTHKKLFKKSLI